MHSLKDTQFWLCYFLFIVPMLKNDLKLCVNHQFIAPSLYNQITQLIFITDRFRPKIKCTTLFGGTLCLCEVMRSVVFCQNFWQITQRLPGNWRGGGKRFSGAFRAGATSPLACLLLSRPFFLVPTTSKRLLRRLGLMFIQKNGDFGAISVTEQSYTTPIFKVDNAQTHVC